MRNISHQTYCKDTEGIPHYRKPSYKQWCVQQRNLDEHARRWKQEDMEKAKGIVMVCCPLVRFAVMSALCTSGQMEKVVELWELNKKELGTGREQLEKQTFRVSSWKSINAAIDNDEKKNEFLSK